LLDRRTGELAIHVPLTSAVQLFYTVRSGTLYISSDLRLLVGPGMTLDERGIYSLFQFGAVVAPLTLWQDIHRLTPGKRTRVKPVPLDVVEEPVDLWDPSPEEAKATERDADAQDELLGKHVDRTLRRLCPDGRPAILFSGGVDSGLLAARAAALGWTDTLLVNYSREEGDPEAALAEAMASHLGLSLVRVTEAPEAWEGALHQIGTSYTHPFGDYATFPNLLLVRRLLEAQKGHSVALDGAGADGVLGAFPKLARWRSLYRIPHWIRRGLGACYGPGQFWADGSRLARRLGWARISTGMNSLLASVIAENPLCGIAFQVPRSVRDEVHGVINARMSEALPFQDREIQARGLDVLHVVRDMMAQKAAPLAQGLGLDIAFPFLDPGLVRLGFQEAVHWQNRGESKAAMKRLLAKHVPSHMVYRPKSGPSPPITEQLQHPATVTAFRDRVLADGNPLRGCLDLRVVRRMTDATRTGQPLPHMTYNFLWTLLFTSLWLDQVGLDP
jgi:asparagine synthetase B (glutamine-hydrolysing)